MKILNANQTPFLTPNQKKIKRSIFGPKTLTVVKGPAGTGKTMLSCDFAIRLLHDEDNKYERLIVTRPLVGVMQEQIGYLPGNIDDKIAPWTDVIDNYTKSSPVEFIPLVFMRGHTFDNSIVIADEMQNSTPEQMKTLLSRIGYNTKLILNGDPYQSDIRDENGLHDITERMTKYGDCEYYDFIELTKEDIKRSEFVKFIYTLYENDEE
jgi:phosphate starvation-inducible protein PhoH and related proteins